MCTLAVSALWGHRLLHLLQFVSFAESNPVSTTTAARVQSSVCAAMMTLGKPAATTDVSGIVASARIAAITFMTLNVFKAVLSAANVALHVSHSHPTIFELFLLFL